MTVSHGSQSIRHLGGSDTPLSVHLNRYHHFTQLMRDTAITCEVRRHASERDDTLQTLMVMRSTNHAQDPAPVFLFCHGMDGDAGDAVVARDLVARGGAVIVAPGGRGPAWVSDAFTADTIQVIRQSREFSGKYYLIGISMGATQVLALAGLLPPDLRERVSGVFAFLPAADLNRTAAESSHPRVRRTLLDSACGDLEALAQRSPIGLVEAYPAGVPVSIMHAVEDTTLLSEPTALFVDRIRHRGHPVAHYEVPGGHEFTYTDLDYQSLFAALGQDFDRARPAPSIADHSGFSKSID